MVTEAIYRGNAYTIIIVWILCFSNTASNSQKLDCVHAIILYMYVDTEFGLCNNSSPERPHDC